MNAFRSQLLFFPYVPAGSFKSFLLLSALAVPCKFPIPCAWLEGEQSGEKQGTQRVHSGHRDAPQAGPAAGSKPRLTTPGQPAPPSLQKAAVPAQPLLGSWRRSEPLPPPHLQVPLGMLSCKATLIGGDGLTVGLDDLRGLFQP